MKWCPDCKVVLEDPAEAVLAGLDTTICFRCGNKLVEK